MRGWGKLVGFAAGLGLLALFLRKTDLGELEQACRSADPALLGLAVAAVLASCLFRALRWRSLLKPIKSTRLKHVFSAMMVGYTVSNLVPGRLGDFVVRPYLIGRLENVSKTAAFGTVVVERIFDALYVLAFFSLSVIVLAPGGSSAINLTVARSAGVVLLLATLAGVVGLFMLRHRGEGVEAWLRRRSQRLPERYRNKANRMAASFVEGLGLFRDTRNAVISCVHGLLCWLLIGTAILAVLRAFGIDGVGFEGILLLIGLTAVGVAIPVPAGMGTFHFFMTQGLLLLGTPNDAVTTGAVLVTHAVTVLPITVVGLSYWLRHSLGGFRLGRLAEEKT
jgi:uncharacterized protein (TIRG00374 family)